MCAHEAFISPRTQLSRDDSIDRTHSEVSDVLGQRRHTEFADATLKYPVGTERLPAPAALEEGLLDAVVNKNVRGVGRSGTALEHPEKEPVVFHQWHVLIAAGEGDRAFAIYHARVVERVVEGSILSDLLLRLRSPTHFLVFCARRIFGELQDGGAQQVEILHQGDLHLEPLWAADVVGISTCDEFIRAMFEDRKSVV